LIIEEWCKYNHCLIFGIYLLNEQSKLNKVVSVCTCVKSNRCLL